MVSIVHLAIISGNLESRVLSDFLLPPIINHPYQEYRIEQERVWLQTEVTSQADTE